jgi:uncharacterized protein YjbI with pentapeptide repeats
MNIGFNQLRTRAMPLLLSALAVWALPVVSAAFVPEDVESLKATRKCAGCDLGKADLRGMDLAGANLEGANLLGANLEGANLEGANLEDASCEKANLNKARLGGIKLEGANLDEAVWSDGRVCQKGSVGSCK